MNDKIIDPGDGWRLLKPKENLIENDEFWCDHYWVKSNSWKYPRSKTSKLVYRRRSELEPESKDVHEYWAIRHENKIIKSGSYVAIVKDEQGENLTDVWIDGVKQKNK